MVIRETKQVPCEDCGEMLTIRSYEGLPKDAWYGGVHDCPYVEIKARFVPKKE